VAKQIYGQKLNERSKLHYKFAKSQSEFLEIMREMLRFSENFHDECSIRSKLVRAKKISQKLDSHLQTNHEALEYEKSMLNLFDR